MKKVVLYRTMKSIKEFFNSQMSTNINVKMFKIKQLLKFKM